MSFDITNEHKSSDYLTLNPYWVIYVLPLKYPVTYKRSSATSFSKDFSQAVALGTSIILTSEVQSVSVNSTKGNHVGSLTAILFPEKEFLSLINPGDYIFCWMMNDENSFNEVVKKLSALTGNSNDKPAPNNFSGGFKFYGKVNSIREQLQQSPDGHRQARFLLNANSFTELDATFFYEEHLSLLPAGPATQIKKMNLEIDKIFDDSKGETGIIPNQMIVSLIDVFLGKGIKKNLGSGQEDPALKKTFGTEGDYAYIVPELVGATLSKPDISSHIQKTADIIEVIHGIQHYSHPSAQGFTENDSKSLYESFSPSGTIQTGSRRWTGENLLGRNTPVPPSLTNKPLWSVLNEYLNPSCNEMYATLRTNPDGMIVPTVIVRQMPFTTDAYSSPFAVTYFQELPRWKIPSIIVRDADIGRSDALRFNFVHIYGTSDTIGARNATQQIVDAPPFADSLDISRSGLRPFMMTVPCWVNETREAQGPKKWMALASDFIIGQQMTLTGILHTIGIQSPICVGDNLEWDGVLYHIESVSHSCQLSADGKKNFSTTLGLTHGIGIDTFKSGEVTDVSLYARVNPDKKESTFIPELTIEKKD